MKKYGVLLVTALLIVASAQASFTVATFQSPSSGSSEPLFHVSWADDLVTGGWDSSMQNLTLEFVWPMAGVFNNVWFDMTPVQITAEPVPNEVGTTGGGTINFYAEGTVADPLMVITFDSGYVSKYGFGSDDAEFSGSMINQSLSEEQFSFSFAAIQYVKKSRDFEALSATAAFNSSAIPEPATLAIFGIGAAMMFRLRKRA